MIYFKPISSFWVCLFLAVQCQRWNDAFVGRVHCCFPLYPHVRGLCVRLKSKYLRGGLHGEDPPALRSSSTQVKAPVKPHKDGAVAFIPRDRPPGWRNGPLSNQSLGYPRRKKWREQRCHGQNRGKTPAQLQRAHLQLYCLLSSKRIAYDIGSNDMSVMYLHFMVF